MSYVLLLFGFVLLVKGADFFVDGSSSLAGILRIPSVIIGLTLVSMGTSAPEAAVSITAGFAGNSDIALGNIVGSNIFNQLIVIGLCALIHPIITHKDILKRDLYWNIAVSVLLLILIPDGEISYADGILLLLGMLLYLAVLIRNSRKNNENDDQLPQMPVMKSLLFILLGLGSVIIGGRLVVTHASMIAASLGMSDTLIGLTIVAIGTSLPELVTSIVAAGKGNSGIALGNAVGSCIFNILFILGAASVLSPIHVTGELIIDTVILIIVCVIILLFAQTSRITNRREGLFCIMLYLLYTAYIIIR